jgi:tRNA (cytidine/uridine-2'-O-)-methyltransferase
MLHVVLYQPEIPPNTGNVIRLCANTGATLHLVKPLGFQLDDKSLQRSGLDYHDLAEVHVHADFEACLNALALSQPRGSGGRIFAVETGGRLCYSVPKYQAGDAFVFGPETRGLPAAVQERIGHENSLFIPMKPKSRSINLSNAVAIVIFDAWKGLGFPGRAKADR